MRKREKSHLSIMAVRNEVALVLAMGDPDEDFMFMIPPTHALRFAEDLTREARKIMERRDDPSA